MRWCKKKAKKKWVGLRVVHSLLFLLLPFHHLHYSSIAGVLIGTLPTEAHGVSGILYVHDDVTLSIERFYYDGDAPGETCHVQLL